MNYVHLILKIIFFKIKIKFRLPLEIKIIIFDKISLNQLHNVIGEYKYFILPGRFENIDEIYLNFEIIKKILFKRKKGLNLAYNLSIIEILSPRLIITMIDNSYLFHAINKEIKNKIPTLAIQLSNRPELIRNNLFFEKKITNKNLNSIFSYNILSAISKYDIKMLKKNKIPIKKSYVNGSLTLANAIKFLKEKKISYSNNKYDICLISDSFTLWMDKAFGVEGWQNGMSDYLKNLIYIIKKNKLKFIFCIKRKGKTLDNEMNFYKKYLTKKELDFLISNSTKRQNYESISPTYEAMLQSKLTISVWSTLLRENLQLKRKSLCVDVDPNNIYFFPLKGICQIKQPTKKELEDRILYILSISNKRYFELIGKKLNYYVYPNYKFTIKKISKLIKNIINKKFY